MLLMVMHCLLLLIMSGKILAFLALKPTRDNLQPMENELSFLEVISSTSAGQPKYYTWSQIDAYAKMLLLPMAILM